MSRLQRCERFLARSLEPGESLLWVEAPPTVAPESPAGRRVLFIGVPLLVVACLVGSVVALNTVDKLSDHAGGFLLFGVPIFSGVALLSWAAVLEQSNLGYGLTERRVLLRAGVFRPRLESLDLLDILAVRLYAARTVELVVAPAFFVAGASGRTRYANPKAFRAPPEGPLLVVRDPSAVQERILAAQRARS